jgi:hypothetical protein
MQKCELNSTLKIPILSILIRMPNISSTFSSFEYHYVFILPLTFPSFTVNSNVTIKRVYPYGKQTGTINVFIMITKLIHNVLKRGDITFYGQGKTPSPNTPSSSSCYRYLH